ncbi:endopeptidase La [Achromobacter xylosoxidans]
MEAGKSIMLVAQKSAGKDDPTPEDVYEIGCVAGILQMLKLPDGTVKVLVEGTQRARINTIEDADSHFTCQVTPIEPDAIQGSETEALRRAIVAQFEQYVKLNKKIPPEILTSLAGIDDAGPPGRHDRRAPAAQARAEAEDARDRRHLRAPRRLADAAGNRNRHPPGRKAYPARVKKQMEKSQRDYYLNEQVKAIQKELGEGEEGADIEELEKKIIAAHMPKEARKKADAELKKLKLMSPMSAEATVVRNYIDTLINLPWKKKSKINNSISNAETVLDNDHYGLEKVKERILEYLAVQQRVDKVKAPILCLVGPPGVGKTSLGQSIAKATNRKFVRMALGGVRDEAEIRGHRRTYIGSMPGKIVQNMTKVGVRNPLFLLDEIDKLGMDFRGDPSSALLEVLDPEQNHTFQDHYIEVDFDLSDVMFVATSNTLNIPPALLDRMEVIRLSGYTEEEKIHIARDHLLPKLMKNNGVKDNELTVDESALRDIVRYYTREAGVRALEREVGKICRKVIKQLLTQSDKAKAEGKTAEAKVVNVTGENLSDYLGVRRYTFGMAEKENQIGQVTGLAWTEVGGDLLTIEVADMPGKGVIQRTGSLGDVMKESVEAARTVVRSRARRLGFADSVFEKHDMHVHVPEGATPKDGPSAGIAITTAMVSALSRIPVRADVAMTGEITLRGEVLPIGGLKEKLLAAHRGGIKTVLIPEENVKDLAEIPDNVKNHLEIVPVRWIDKVLELALERLPEPLAEEEAVKEPLVAKPAEPGSTDPVLKH